MLQCDVYSKETGTNMSNFKPFELFDLKFWWHLSKMQKWLEDALSLYLKTGLCCWEAGIILWVLTLFSADGVILSESFNLLAPVPIYVRR